MFQLAEIVDTHALLQVVWVSLLAGTGVTAFYALAILGATRAADYSRAGRTGEALLLGVLCVVALAVVAASVVFGIVVMTQK
jgi:hypothetical protein